VFYKVILRNDHCLERSTPQQWPLQQRPSRYKDLSEEAVWRSFILKN